MINKSFFGRLPGGSEVFLYSLRNKNGTQVNIINFGAIVTNIFFRDKQDKVDDIVLGYDSLKGYITDKAYMGGIVGRYGNRIAKGKFKIGENEFQLAVNNGKNHLHGGLKGFNKVLWDIESSENESSDYVKLTYISSDGEEGYPGRVKLEVIYTLTDEDELKIIYKGTTDKTTILNPTHHSYFNLTGNLNKTILGHELRIEADRFLPTDQKQIPAGTIEDVKDTPMDFLSLTSIGLHINENYSQLEIADGYDHNWVLNNFTQSIKKAASLYEPSSGRFMDVFTDQPGLQFYSGNSLDGSAEGKGGIKYNKRTGLCLEAQYFPDSPNNSLFPSTILIPGEIYKQETIYKFSIIH